MEPQPKQTEKYTKTPCSAAEVQSFLARVASTFADKPFRPHSLFRGGHAQTLAGYAWPRRYRFTQEPLDKRRLFEIEPGVKVLALCRWQKDRHRSSTIVIWHGMEGSASSVYMLAMADKLYRTGFNVVRVNLRTCGGTEHLTPTLYHGGMSGDLHAVMNELITADGLQRIFALGFSLGGNVLLKLAGEYGPNPPHQVAAICAVSPSVDLRASTDSMRERRNWIYQQSFVHHLKKRIRVKHRIYPELYDLGPLSKIRSIRDFDEEFTSRANGFRNADDYYSRSSAIRVAGAIHVPTLIIHAEDDPFIPFEPLREKAFSKNPNILLAATKEGGHVAFISSETYNEDRFWAENRAVEFYRMAEAHLPSYF